MEFSFIPPNLIYQHPNEGVLLLFHSQVKKVRQSSLA